MSKKIKQIAIYGKGGTGKSTTTSNISAALSSGIAHYAYYGQITRLAGADAVVYPNFGGRFSFSKGECISIAEGTTVQMNHLKTIFPSPGGGMSLEKIPEMLEVYGNEVIFLVGGGLFKHGPDLIENCRYFRAMVEQYG